MKDRHEIEEALRESEEKYRTLFSLSSDAMFFCDVNTLKILEANDGAVKTYGYTIEEMLTMKITDISAQPEETRNTVINEVKQIPLRYHKRKDGTIFPAEINTTTFICHGKKVQIGVVRDITDRMNIEQSLRESEIRYKKLYHYATVGLFESDIKTGKIIACNQLLCNLLGISSIKEEPDNYTKYFYVNQEDREIVRKLLNEKGYVENYALQLRNKLTGNIFWASFSARLNNETDIIEGTITDITEKKKAEEILMFTQFAVDHTKDCAFWTDSKGQFIYVNDSTSRELGYSREELLKMKVSDIDPDYNDQTWPVRWQELKKQGSFIVERTHMRKDGSLFPVEITGNYVEFSGKEYNCAFIRNVTERKIREKEIRRLLAILEATSDFIASSNANSNVVYINRAGLKLIGRAEDTDITNLTIPSVHPPWAFEIVKNTGIPCAVKHGIWEGETAILHRDGHEIPVSQVIMAHLLEDGSIDYLSTIMRDITEIKKVQEDLSAEKERLFVTLGSIGDGVIATDTEGRITIMNNVSESLTEWTAEEALGRPLSDIFNIIHETTGEQCENPVTKVLLTGKIIELANHTALISKNGKKIIIADSGAPIKDKTGQIIGVVLVFRDITEKQKMLDHLQKAQKLDSLGLLAGGIAHDFNNLLGGIFGYLDLAKESCKEEEVFSYISGAFQVYERAKSLTQQLLTFARGGVPIKKPGDLSSLLKDTVKFALIGSRTKPLFSIQKDLWPCNFDSHQLSQVIDNIIINGQQSMPSGGDIIVSAENVKNIPHHIPLNEGKYIKISITDHGTGIPKEYLPNIFDPFFTTKQKGSGLGLSIAYSIVQKHDGIIDVQSEQGKGTTFTIYIPASEYCCINQEPVKSSTHKGKGKILIMDDESHIRDIAGKILQKMGYSVVTTKNGLETIDAFIEAYNSKEPFSIAFLDLTIPGAMGGKEVISELQKLCPSIKSIAISGYSEDPVIAEPEIFGFTASLKKPFTINELSKLLNKIS